MIEEKKVLAVIPARGGSKRVPRKNLKAVSGKPMILYTIEAARACEYIDKVVVSTDDEEIAELSMKAKAVVPFRRPDELASDDADLIGVVLHALDFYEKKGERYDIVTVLLPSSPLRTEEDVRRAIESFIKEGEKSLQSVSEVAEPPQRIRTFREKSEIVPLFGDGEDEEKDKNKKTYYTVNGAIYVNRVLDLDKNTDLEHNEIGFVLPKERGIYIEYPEDVVVADYYLSQDCDAEYLSFIVY